jgi:hypothetical protein
VSKEESRSAGFVGAGGVSGVDALAAGVED